LTALELYNQKVPVKAIARQIGYSEGHTRKILKAQGYGPNRIGGTRITKEQAFQAAEMDLEGYSWSKISEQVGYSWKALKRAIKYYAAQDIK
jgi:AraC-like DNA-binding protein